MTTRGTYGFELLPNGNLADTPQNLERLRRLFRDGAIIKSQWGPGAGESDNGSWHILCHLVAGAGVFKKGSNFLWVGITHKGVRDEYEATVSFRDGQMIKNIRLDSPEGRAALQGAYLLGFVEGSSCGHILARGVNDAETAFNGYRRQEYDKDVTSNDSGGTVWEHWCTTRDLRESSAIGSSVLRGYSTLVATLGGHFVAAVARGRREHDHPIQFCALVKAGVLTEADATWDITPRPIPEEAQKMLYEARPMEYVKAAESLGWPRQGGQCYFMFKRRIGSWSPAFEVKRDLAAFTS